ncbi:MULTISPECIES: hypothetical protein [Candidatus Ichthyocystis]|uniref:Putative membrane protein n=1 Tax=Candidatus Ichthyocystis hellenicum TaxID=1561003 RepID=A0A0S4M0V6_9BURK|nr:MULTISPECIES: hypothetical protein [Ichthyocystis]CUT16864.1 putative membrane protein [Candidatus Ichthyocystis hellenicum]
MSDSITTSTYCNKNINDDESQNGTGEMSQANIVTTSRTSSLVKSSRSTLSLCRSALKTSLIFSVLSQATAYIIKPADIISTRLTRLLVRYMNIQCLIRNILSLGEINLISSGIDVRSGLEQVGTTPEEILSKIHNLEEYRITKRINRTSMDDIVDNANIDRIEYRYNRIKEVALGICDRIKNSSPFNIESRNRLSNFSELVRANEDKYYTCPNIIVDSINRNIYAHSYDHRSMNSMATERTVIVIIVLGCLCALFYFFILGTRRFKASRNRSKINQHRLRGKPKFEC